MTLPISWKSALSDTHPWLTFEFDLNELGPSAWALLGHAAAAFEFMRGIPLQPSVAKELHTVYLAKGALATTAIEGNTLSEKEALRQVEGRGNLPPSREYLGREIDNVVRAVNDIADTLLGNRDGEVTPDLLKKFNRQVLAHDIPIAEAAVPGEYRTYNVGVGSYRAVPYEHVEEAMDYVCTWLNTAFSSSAHRDAKVQVVKAILAHLYFVWIHPFGDGNGRTARLLEFYILVSAGAPSPAAHLLSHHYNQTRSMYYRNLDEASRVHGSPAEFVRYGVEGLVDGLNEQVAWIKQQQMAWAWESFYHEQLRGRRGEAWERRLRLIEALSREPAPVLRRSIRTLSGELALAYRSKTDKTVTRDIHALGALGLIVKSREGIRAHTDQIKAFLT